MLLLHRSCRSRWKRGSHCCSSATTAPENLPSFAVWARCGTSLRAPSPSRRCPSFSTFLRSPFVPHSHHRHHVGLLALWKTFAPDAAGASQYNVLGTLQDQLFYPTTVVDDSLSEEDLRAILCQVDLEHLVERDGAMEDEINWENELSLGGPWLFYQEIVLPRFTGTVVAVSFVPLTQCCPAEKQRLAIARLLLQKPRFCILDEVKKTRKSMCSTSTHDCFVATRSNALVEFADLQCSSAISDEMTRRLYEVCKEQKCAYITIAHRESGCASSRFRFPSRCRSLKAVSQQQHLLCHDRPGPALKAYHDRVLSIGDVNGPPNPACAYLLGFLPILWRADGSWPNGQGKQGFTLEDIPSAERVAAQTAIAASARAAEGADAKLRQLMKERSAKYKAGGSVQNKEGTGLPDRGMLLRALRIIRLGWIDYLPLRITASLAGIFLQVAMQNYQMMNVGHMFGCLMTGDLARMMVLSRNSLLLTLVQPVVYESVLFLQREIGHDMMERAQDYMMERLLRNDNYYKMSTIDGRIKDTQQRVCGDCHEVFHHFDSLVVNGLVSFLKLCFYTYRIGVFLDMRYPAGLWAYFAVSTFCLKLAMPDFKSFHMKMSRLDHAFKFVHARLKMCAESIAFFE